MSCDDIKKLLPGFLYETLEEQEEASVRAHLETCGNCQGELQKIKKTLALCNLWGDETPPSALAHSTISLIKEKKPSILEFLRRIPWFPKLGYMLAGLLAVCMAISFYCGYYLTPDDQQTIVYSSDQLLAGSPVSFRVVLLTRSDGRPVPGGLITLELKARDSNKSIILFKSRTDKNGSLEPLVTIPDLKEGRYDLLVHAKSSHGRDRIVRAVSITRTYRMLLSTDKPIYQPGQVIHMRMIVVENGKRRAARGGSALFEVLDPKGNKVFKKSVPIAQYGVVSADFMLAREINLGEYHIKTQVGDDTAERVVEVKRYVLPKFKISFNPARRIYLPSETITGNITGEYFFGKHVQNARVTLDLSTFDVAFHKIAHIEGKTNARGEYDFSLSLPSYFVGQPLDKGKGILKCDVSIIDGAGHEEKVTDTLTVAQSTEEDKPGEHETVSQGKIPITIDCIPERKTLLAGVENRIFVVTSLPGGNPIAGDVALMYDKEILRAQTDEFGVAGFVIKPSQNRLSLQLTARKGQQFFGKSHFDLSAEMGRDEVLLSADRSLYKVGDEMKLTVLSPDPKGTVYVDIIRDRQALLTRSLDLSDGRALMALDLSEDMAGTLQLNAYRITREGYTVRDSRTVVVSQSKEIVVTSETDKKVYRPGEKARLSFQVRDGNGKPLAAALGLSIVDESVFALSEKHPGLEKVYLALEKELMEPKIELCEHNCSLDMTGLTSRSSYSPGAQQAASVILAALGDLPGGEFINSTAEKLGKLQQKMANFRTAGFSLLGILVLAVFLWIALKVSEIEARRRTKDESPLLKAVHLVGLVILSLILGIYMCRDALDYSEGYFVLLTVTLFIVAFLLPFLSILAYFRRYGGRGSAIAYSVIVMLANIAIFKLLRNAHIINDYDLVPSTILGLSLFTGIISLFTGAMLSMRARFGPLGLMSGVFLLITIIAAILKLSTYDMGLVLLYILIFIVGALVMIGLAPRKMKPVNRMMELFIVAAIFAILALIILPNFMRARAQGTLTACKSNLKNIGTSLEMYSTDHRGRYPQSLSELVPAYLNAIPTCPSAGKDTYSAGYRSTMVPDAYYLCCFGSNHIKEGLAANQPCYDSVQGLIEGVGDDSMPSAGALPETGKEAPKQPPATIAGIRVRQFFPETLYWNPLLITDESGKAHVDIDMADSITTWRLTGTAHTEQGIIGSFNAPLRVFQDFFIDPDLPEHLTRGDLITLPVALYNYLPREQELKVSLVSDTWFEVSGPSEKRVTLKPNDVASISFTIRVREVGDFRFTVLARSDSEKDAVSKQIRVDPDGKETIVTNNGTLDKDIHCTVPIPKDCVPGGSTILVKVYPGVTTQILDGLEGMLTMPYG